MGTKLEAKHIPTPNILIEGKEEVCEWVKEFLALNGCDFDGDMVTCIVREPVKEDTE